MAKIWFIRREEVSKDYGPFFSTKERAIAFLREDDCDAHDDLTDSIDGTDPYINIIEVVLDDERVCFDG